MIFLSLFAVILVFFAFKSRRYFFIDPYTIFFISYLYYNYYTFITVWLFEVDAIFLNSILVVFDSYVYQNVSIILFTNFLGFTLGYKLAAGGIYKEYTKHFNSNSVGSVYVKFFIFIIALLVAINVENFSQSIISYASNVELTYDNTAYSIAKNLILGFSFFVFLYYIFRSERYYLVLLLGITFFVFFGVATYDKDPFLMAGFLIFYFLHRWIRNLNTFKITFYMLLTFASVVLILYTLLPMFSIYRSTGTFELIYLQKQDILLILSDAVGALWVITYFLKDTYLTNVLPFAQSFVMWVPKFIWDRPFDLSQQLAFEVVEKWEPGQGVGFSIVAEGYLRFGFYFSWLFFMFVGAFFGLTLRIFASLIPTPLVVPAVFASGSLTAFLAQRGTLSTMTTNLMQFWVPFIFICLLVKMIFPKSKKVVLKS